MNALRQPAMTAPPARNRPRLVLCGGADVRPRPATADPTFSALALDALRAEELDAFLPGEDAARVYYAVDKALLCTDDLSAYSKFPECPGDRSRTIFALKNMLLSLLWRERRDLFRGVWKHTSLQKAQRCWACNGSGDGEQFGERCGKCGGSGQWKRPSEISLTVFALESGRYSATWHLPTNRIVPLLGRDVPYGDDLIATGAWVTDDLKKFPRRLSQSEYEERRSFLAWFIRRARAQADSLLFLKR